MTAKKFTLLIPSGPAHDHERKHLFIILTNPCDQGKQLLVSISSYRDDDTCDETCILNPGDHEFIRRKSFVVYRRCQITETAALLRGLRDGKLVPREPMDADIFEDICEGLLSSIFTPKRFIDYFEKNRYNGDDPEPAEEVPVED